MAFCIDARSAKEALDMAPNKGDSDGIQIGGAIPAARPERVVRQLRPQSSVSRKCPIPMTECARGTTMFGI